MKLLTGPNASGKSVYLKQVRYPVYFLNSLVNMFVVIPMIYAYEHDIT